MPADHIFIASGGSCPICTALNGAVVPAGYSAHANCRCQTIPREDGGECTWDFTTVTHRNGSGPMDAIIEIDVEVTCPDGSLVGSQTSFDASVYGETDAEFDRFVEDIGEAAEAVASDICASCPPAPPVS